MQLGEFSLSDYLPGEKPLPEKGKRKRGTPSVTEKVDRLPPHHVESEQGVLGCCLLDPGVCIGQCVEAFPAGPEVFYDLRHQTIYEVMVSMYEARIAVDIITLASALKDKHRLEEVGGFSYLDSLPEATPSAANLVYYTDAVNAKYTLRRMMHTCTEVVARIQEYEGDVASLTDQTERDILAIGESSRKRKTCEVIKEPVKRAVARIEEYQQRQGELTGQSYGFADIDKMTGGMHGGEMIVIAARPSMGKTSLAMNIAEYVSTDCHIPSGVFSLEMSTDSLVERMLCSRARVNLRNVKEGYVAEKEYPMITNAAGKLSAAPIYIDDEAGISIGTLRAKARRMYQSFGCRMFVIDYLQLLHAIKGRGQRFEKRQEEVAEISGGIKSLAKELNVPVIVLSQLNRALDKNAGRKPNLSDLRESGAIEQDADLVGMLYKPSIGNAKDDDDEKDVIPVNLNIAKQRNGPTGDVKLIFLKQYTRFESAAKVGYDEVPQDAQGEMI